MGTLRKVGNIDELMEEVDKYVRRERIEPEDFFQALLAACADDLPPDVYKYMWKRYKFG